MTLPPGSTIGILGGGQLGRMLAMAAATLGYRVHVYAPGASGPASEVAARWTRGDYADTAALHAFAAQVDVLTYEFENVDVGALRGLEHVHPAVAALEAAQDRLTEKRFATDQDGTPAPHRAVDSAEDLRAAAAEIGVPAILKTRRLGYDGKGQVRIGEASGLDAAWEAIGGRPAVLEGQVAFEAEFSIILARGHDGQVVRWPAATNRHRDGILHLSSVPPSGIVAEQEPAAAALAERIAAALGYAGVLACEFFATAAGPVFNEMAPRVHNSGHWSIEGAVTSQFENHIRAICGLPLGATALAGQGAEMRNLLGDDVAGWPAILADPAAHLHLYGKGQPRPGRKMGHVTRVTP